MQGQLGCGCGFCHMFTFFWLTCVRSGDILQTGNIILGWTFSGLCWHTAHVCLYINQNRSCWNLFGVEESLAATNDSKVSTAQSEKQQSCMQLCWDRGAQHVRRILSCIVVRRTRLVSILWQLRSRKHRNLHPPEPGYKVWISKQQPEMLIHNVGLIAKLKLQVCEPLMIYCSQSHNFPSSSCKPQELVLPKNAMWGRESMGLSTKVFHNLVKIWTHAHYILYGADCTRSNKICTKTRFPTPSDKHHDSRLHILERALRVCAVRVSIRTHSLNVIGISVIWTML